MDKKYPSKKNIKLLFNRFGIKDILKAMTAKGKKIMSSCSSLSLIAARS
ncbi:hypothetical protein ECDEC2A_2477 [Escherichia coli DEC2A]|nr:hypothetical protein ECDEC2A_2477 [Escherichia coli DEC2A]